MWFPALHLHTQHSAQVPMTPHTMTWPATCVTSVLTDFPEKLTLFKMWSHQRGGTNARSVRTVSQFPVFCTEPPGQEGPAQSDSKPKAPLRPQTRHFLTTQHFLQTRRKWEVTVCTNQAHRANRMGLSHQLKLHRQVIGHPPVHYGHGSSLWGTSMLPPFLCEEAGASCPVLHMVILWSALNSFP